MRLWPEEFEQHRPEALEAAELAYFGLAGDPDAPPGDPLDGLNAARSGAPELFPFRADSAVDRTIEGVPCRVIEAPGTPSGVYLHFHGGGMCLASAELNDDENLILAETLGLTVVSVDYRLAPEHPYPAAVEDSIAVARWLLAHSGSEFGTETRIIGGESAGAYLAAMTLLALRELFPEPPFAAANFVSGVFDWGRSPSQRGFRPTDGPDWLSPEAMAQFADFYLPGLTDDERRDRNISPAFADLKGLPPALFTIGTLDHMFDDSLMMASRWTMASSDAELAVYPDCGHGFQWFTDTELSRRAVRKIYGFLARYSASPPMPDHIQET